MERTPSYEDAVQMNNAQPTWAQIHANFANNTNSPSVASHATYNVPVTPPSALEVQAIQIAESRPGIFGIKNPCCLGLSGGVWCRFFIAWFIWCSILGAISMQKYDICKADGMEFTCYDDRYEITGYANVTQIEYDACSEYPDIVATDECSDTKDAARSFTGCAFCAFLICTCVIVWDCTKHLPCLGLKQGVQQYCCLHSGICLTSFLCLMCYYFWDSNEKCCSSLTTDERTFDDEGKGSINLIIFAWFMGIFWLISSITCVEHLLFGTPADWSGSYMNNS